MNPSDDKKADILLQLLDQNRKQTEWVKNLDMKIVYYCLGFFVVCIGWFSAHPPQSGQVPLLVSSFVLLAFLSILFLVRNHSRHHGLNTEFNNILEALNLMEPNHYSLDPVFKKWETKNSWAFHFGRGLYSFFILCGAVLAIAFVTSVAPNKTHTKVSEQEQNKTGLESNSHLTPKK